MKCLPRKVSYDVYASQHRDILIMWDKPGTRAAPSRFYHEMKTEFGVMLNLFNTMSMGQIPPELPEDWLHWRDVMD